MSEELEEVIVRSQQMYMLLLMKGGYEWWLCRNPTERRMTV